MNDLPHAIRQLRKHPFTNGVIILTIALLIGAISVIYASLRDEQARLAPFPESERMVKLFRVGDKRVEQSFPPDLVLDYASHLTSFEELGTIDIGRSLTLTEVGEPVSYNSANVSASLLRIARVTPLRGRIFDDLDETNDSHSILISEQLWRNKFGSDEGIVGREVHLSESVFTVVGVLPGSMRNTRLAFGVDLWIPRHIDRTRGNVNLKVFTRIKPGVSMARAQTELEAVTPGLERNHTPNAFERTVAPSGYFAAKAVPLEETLRGARGGIPMEMVLVWLFAGTIIASVVGIACFNVTNLLLARLSARSRELAIRCSLGADRGRIVRHILTETILLATLGGVAGLLVSFWFHGLLKLQSANVRLDWRLYAMSAGGTLLLGVLVGLLPALQSTRLDMNAALKDGGNVGGRRRYRLRNFLICSEVAMALILCVVAGLMVRSCLKQLGGDPGFKPERVVAFRVDLRADTHPGPEDRNAYIERALIALREVPGVESAAVTMSPSVISYGLQDQIIIEETGHEPVPAKLLIDFVSQGYPGISGMRLLRGRNLSEDPVKAENEAVVNEAFVREHFEGRDPIGSRLHLDFEPKGTQRAVIVGVLRDRHPATTYMEPQPEVLMGSRRTTTSWGGTFLAATRGNAKPMAQTIRAALQSLDANQPVNQPEFMDDLMNERNRGPRNAIVMLGSFACVGLFIALMGLYGVVAFTVTERTREVGIRMAVGASRAQVLRLVMWQGARLMLIGTVPGLLIGATVVAILPQGRFIGIKAFDPLTHLVIVLVVGTAGCLASALPARKAANLNPMEALRYE